MTPRPLTQHEISVIRAAIARAAAMEVPVTLLDGLEELRVVGRCDCGCDSVDFVAHDPQRPSRPIADGFGETPAGGTVGIIIWGTNDALTGIEVYDLGAGAEDIKLPVESSIRPW
jgi:phosphoglycerate dehydrogenase-like enzyme